MIPVRQDRKEGFTSNWTVSGRSANTASGEAASMLPSIARCGCGRALERGRGTYAEKLSKWVHREDHVAADNLQKGMKDEHLIDHCCDGSLAPQTCTPSAFWGQGRVTHGHCFPGMCCISRPAGARGQGLRVTRGHCFPDMCCRKALDIKFGRGAELH